MKQLRIHAPVRVGPGALAPGDYQVPGQVSEPDAAQLVVAQKAAWLPDAPAPPAAKAAPEAPGDIKPRSKARKSGGKRK